MHTTMHIGHDTLLPTMTAVPYHQPMMKHPRKQIRDLVTPERLKRWRPLFPYYSDPELAEVIRDIDDYLRISWRIFRSQNERDSLPEDL